MKEIHEKVVESSVGFGIFDKPVKEKRLPLYQCDQCGYSTKKRKDLEKHIYRMHTNPRKKTDLKCDQCDYVATQKSNLDYHKKSKVHEKESISYKYKKLYKLKTDLNMKDKEAKPNIFDEEAAVKLLEQYNGSLKDLKTVFKMMRHSFEHLHRS